MYYFNDRSKAKLETCHPDLVLIMNEAIKVIDFTVLEGARSDDMQKEYFAQGRSKLDGVTKKSKHQVSADQPLSRAVDIAPWPVVWNDTSKFCFLAGVIKGVAAALYSRGEIKNRIRWGGDWNDNNDFKDQSFVDLPHFELI